MPTNICMFFLFVSFHFFSNHLSLFWKRKKKHFFKHFQFVRSGSVFFKMCRNTNLEAGLDWNNSPRDTFVRIKLLNSITNFIESNILFLSDSLDKRCETMEKKTQNRQYVMSCQYILYFFKNVSKRDSFSFFDIGLQFSCHRFKKNSYSDKWLKKNTDNNISIIQRMKNWSAFCFM